MPPVTVVPDDEKTDHYIKIGFPDAHNTIAIGPELHAVDLGQIIIAHRILGDMIEQQFLQARLQQARDMMQAAEDDPRKKIIRHPLGQIDVKRNDA